MLKCTICPYKAKTEHVVWVNFKALSVSMSKHMYQPMIKQHYTNRELVLSKIVLGTNQFLHLRAVENRVANPLSNKGYSIKQVAAMLLQQSNFMIVPRFLLPILTL